MGRAVMGISAGFLSGVLIVAFGLALLVTATVRDKHSDWSEEDQAAEPVSEEVWSRLTGPGLPIAIGIGVIGGVNGAIGAWSGRRSGARKPWPPLWVPLLLLLYPLVLFAQHPDNSKLWGGELFTVVIIGVFVWASGRVGQELGARIGGDSGATRVGA